MMIRSISELIRYKLDAAAKARWAYAMAAASGDTRVARRCKCSHEFQSPIFGADAQSH